MSIMTAQIDLGDRLNEYSILASYLGNATAVGITQLRREGRTSQ